MTAPSEPARLFQLVRDRDDTGVSGTGVVADGVLWPDGTVTVRWRGERRSTVNWDRMDDAVQVHGHDGRTRIVWVSAPPRDTRGTAGAWRPLDQPEA